MAEATEDVEDMADKDHSSSNINDELPIPPTSLVYNSASDANFENSGIVLDGTCESVVIANTVENADEQKNQNRSENERTDNRVWCYAGNVQKEGAQTDNLDNSKCDNQEDTCKNKKELGIIDPETEKIPDDSLSNKKLKVVLNLDGLRESKGLLYIGCRDEKKKTNPCKIVEWFTPDFLNLHGVYAIKEEEPFLLRVFTRNHESTNRGIRKKGGRKVMLMGQEVFGDVLLACGHCGYWSHEGSNVRRHLKKSVCLKERGYTKEDLAGLDRIERRKFLRRLAAAKCRAKKKAKVTSFETAADGNQVDSVNNKDCDANGYPQYNLSSGLQGDTYAECLTDVQENCLGTTPNRPNGVPNGVSHSLNSALKSVPPPAKVKRKPPKHKALSLGPAIVKEVVQRVSYDIYTLNENNERIAWKPPSCHKYSQGDRLCQIVFKGARMKRRCMDLPIPMVLIYRKLDCKMHHCNFTLFHPSARVAFKNDPLAKASVNVKMYGDIVMTQEFYHYFVSLLSIMKMKSSQTARHLTSVWETIITERLGTSSIPDEHRKVITLSKQTVKSIWSCIEEEAGSKGSVKLMRGSKKKKKPPSQPTPAVAPVPPPDLSCVNHHPPLPVGACAVGPVPISQSGMQHHCMKRINHIQPKPPPPPPPPKPPMMTAPPPPHNHMQQPPHAPVSHAHWLSQGPQYPHNMAPYPMAPPPAPEYYPMPGHFMAQYTPATMGTSP
ncbi:hypothetical protein SK128_012750 [Halocaridina rubra]|uniref:Uncharacterized protein n=1 Tax=Halocaridina rubra TaxID=373956 RepID=A0AAN9A1V7_HALRR